MCLSCSVLEMNEGGVPGTYPFNTWSILSCSAAYRWYDSLLQMFLHVRNRNAIMARTETGGPSSLDWIPDRSKTSSIETALKPTQFPTMDNWECFFGGKAAGAPLTTTSPEVQNTRGYTFSPSYASKTPCLIKNRKMYHFTYFNVFFKYSRKIVEKDRSVLFKDAVSL